MADGWLSGLAGLGNLLYQIYRDQSLTGAQREANTFSSSEADRLRGWQEDMYNKYSSPQAMIRQFQDAGLNPGLMYGSSPSPSAPVSSALPASVTPNAGDVTGALHMLYGLKDLKASITEKIEAAGEHAAGAAEKRANARGKEISNEYAPMLAEAELAIKGATVDQLKESANFIAAQAETEKEKKAVQSALKALTDAQMNGQNLQNAYEKWRLDFIDTNGYAPDQPIWNAVTSVTGALNQKSQEGKENVTRALTNILRALNGWYHDHSTDPLTLPNPE